MTRSQLVYWSNRVSLTFLEGKVPISFLRESGPVVLVPY